MKLPMTDKEIRDHLKHRLEADPDVEILYSGNRAINFHEKTYGRYITYRTHRISKTELGDMIHFGASYMGKGIGYWRNQITQRLLNANPRILMSVKNIFVVATSEDLIKLCQACAMDEDTLPESLFDEDGGLDVEHTDLACVHWKETSTVIVNVTAIKDVCKGLFPGDPPERLRKEIAISFWSTLFYGIRTNFLDNMRYDAPWDDDNGVPEDAPDPVELWCRAEFEKYARELVYPL